MNQSIVLLDESAIGVLDLLIELSGEGMLHDLLVVSHDGLTRHLDGRHVTQVELGEHLAGRAMRLARVLHLSLSGDAVSASHLERVGHLQSTLNPVGITVELASLVVPLAGTTVKAGAFPQYWNYNLLVQPVDMAGEPGFAVLPLTNPDKQLVVATAAAALCGGLWKWLDAGPLDRGRFKPDGGKDAGNYDADVNGARVRIVRATTRMVDAGNIASQAIAVAFAPGAKFPPPPGCIPHGDDAQAVNDLAREIAPDGNDSYFGFSYRPYVPPAPPRRPTLTPWRAIVAFLKEFWQHLSRMPLEAVMRQWARVKRAVEEAVANRTYGPDSDIRVSFEREGPLEVAIDPARRADAVAGLADLNLSAPPPTPAAWSGLMSVLLGSADGGEFPAGCGVDPPTWANQRAVIASANAIAPVSLADQDGGSFTVRKSDAEQLGWTGDDDLVIPGADANAADILLGRLRDVAQPAGGSTEETSPSADQQEEQSTTILPKDLEKLSERLTNWIDQRSSTLVWKLAGALGREQTRALDDLARTSTELEEVLEQMMAAEEVEVASRKKFARKAFIIVGLLLALILIVAVGFIYVAFVSIIVWFVVLIGGLIGLLWAMVRTAAERVREAHRRDELASRPQQLIEQRRNAAQEYIRLALLYRQFQDWAQIAAIALHRPLGNVQKNVLEPWETTVGALSFVCGKPKFDMNRIQATTLRIMQLLATQGWLSRAYQRQREMVSQSYGSVAGGLAATDTSPESDVAGNDVIARLPGWNDTVSEVVVFGPRTNLLVAFRSDIWSARYRDEQVSALQQAVVSADSFEMIEAVECDVVGLNTPPREPGQFLAPVVEWDQAPTFTNMFAPQRAVDGVPTGSVVGISQGLEAKMIPGRRLTVPVVSLENRFTLASFRLDISDAVDLGDVVMVEVDRAAPVAPPVTTITPNGSDPIPYG